MVNTGPLNGKYWKTYEAMVKPFDRRYCEIYKAMVHVRLMDGRSCKIHKSMVSVEAFR